MKKAPTKAYELHNNVDGYQASGTLKEMKHLGRVMIEDDREHGLEWLGPYWITDEVGHVVYKF